MNITPQYLFDYDGKPIGVFLNIEDWQTLLRIPAITQYLITDNLPDWHVDLGKTELESITNNTSELKGWKGIKNHL